MSQVMFTMKPCEIDKNGSRDKKGIQNRTESVKCKTNQLW